MTEDMKVDRAERQIQARRAFLKGAGKAAVSAPAVMLILSASTKQASADAIYIRPPCDLQNPDAISDGIQLCDLNQPT